MALPSLILRLEHLERPDVPLEQHDVVRIPDVAADESTQTPSGDEPAESEAAEPAELAAAHTILTGRHATAGAAPERLSSSTSLSRWSAAVAAAHDACFVLDATGAVISVSVPAIELLGSGDATAIGRHILDVVHLVDLDTGEASPEYAPRITPLFVLEVPGLARSLMRVRHDDGSVVTLDTSSAPIHDVADQLLGSITFIAPIPAR